MHIWGYLKTQQGDGGVGRAANIFEGVLARITMKDVSRIRPVWFLAILSFVLNGMKVISVLAGGSLEAGTVISLAINLVFFMTINNMKKDAEM